MDHSRTFDKLEQLAKRVSQATDSLTTLRTRCESLQEEKRELENKIKELNDSNKQITNQINDLKLFHERSSKSFDKEDVRKRIDHMLEKFAELQL